MNHRNSIAAVVVATGLMASTALAQPVSLDHLKCYKVKDTAKFVAGVSLNALQTQFGMEDCKLAGKAQLFCVPVDKEVTVFDDKTKPPLNPGSFPAQKLAEDRICYKIKCPKVVIPDEIVTDQFGTRTVGKFKPFLLCTPAKKGDDPPPKECDLTGPQCNGLCPDSNDKCLPIVGTVDCECVPPPVPCDQTAPQCNGDCPIAGDVCMPNADGTKCDCTKPPLPCSQSGPQCNGDCPTGAQCFQNAAGQCDCFDVPVKCEQSVAPQCGGACPVGAGVCTYDAAANVCDCQPQTPSCTDPAVGAPTCDGLCPQGTFCAAQGQCQGTTIPCLSDADCTAAQAPCILGNVCDCLSSTGVSCGTLAGPPQCYGDCAPDQICIDDGLGGCRCDQ